MMIGGYHLRLADILLLAPFLLSQAQNLQLGEWQQIQYTTTTTISARISHAGAFMSSTNEYLVFGGLSPPDLGDFHSINMISLQSTQLAVSSTLGERSVTAYTSDLVSNFYVHGGVSGSVNFNDFWRFNAQTRTWTQLAKGPSARRGHCLEWDQGREQLILFGGDSGIGLAFFNDLWTYLIKSDLWQQATPVRISIPAARSFHACAFNTQSSTFLIQGGWASQFYQDLRQFDFQSNSWTLINAGNLDVNLFGHSMRYSKSLNSLWVFFGQVDFLFKNTIYQYSFNNPSAGWTLLRVRTSQMPSAKSAFSTGYNTLNGEYYVFGGYNGSTSLNDFAKIRIDDPIIPLTPTPETDQRLLTSAIIVVQTSGSVVQLTDRKTTLQLSSVTLETVSLVVPTATKQTSGSVVQLTDRKTTLQLSSATLERVSLVVPTTIKTQLGTLKKSTFSQNPIQQNSSSFLAVLQDYQYYLIASLIILLLLIWLLWFCLNRRRNRLKDRASVTSTMNTSLRKIQTTTSGQYTLSSNFSMSKSSSIQISELSQDQTISITLASNELGLSIPAYLHVDYSASVIERKVFAQGGFGIVILADAIDSKLKQYGDHVIVKRIKKPKLFERDIQLFNQELSLMEYFKNEKFVAKLLGYSTNPFCLIMKYYEMGSLKQFIRTVRNMKKNHVHAFTKDISSGLLAMHVKGVVHNDLKPDNVLLDMQHGLPFCVLTDFGISQIITPQILKIRQFQVAQIKGLSMAYAAPERIKLFRKGGTLDSVLVDRQIIFSWDLYSLGLIMFELVTARSQWL